MNYNRISCRKPQMALARNSITITIAVISLPVFLSLLRCITGALVPFSVLQLPRKFYEVFIAWHVALFLLFLIGYYRYTWCINTYTSGCEICLFVAAGIRAVERLVRIVRMVVRSSTAVVTLPSFLTQMVNTYQSMLELSRSKRAWRIFVFPTVCWRLWKNHPFWSVGVNRISIRSSISHLNKI